MKNSIIWLMVFVPALVIGQSNHTVTFTGDPANDFNAAEKYTSGAVDYYLTFNATTIYFGAKNTGGNFGGADVLSIFIDTDPNSTPSNGIGLTLGPAYNGVTPTLPFSANYTIKVERSYNESREYSGTWGSTTGTEVTWTADNAREVRMDFSNLGNPSSLYVIMWMGYNGGYWAPAPSSNPAGPSGTPAFTNYFGGFNLNSGVTPLSITDSSLPVSLSKFTGRSLNGFVALDWATDSEIENLGFNVYRAVRDNPLELLAFFTDTKSLEGYGSTNEIHEYSYSDNRVNAGETYRYVLADVDYNGVEKRHDDRAVTLTYTPGADEVKPVKFALTGAYPNPFNPSTTIQYAVPEAGPVAFTIYDLQGRKLWSANQSVTSAGEHQMVWSGTNTDHQAVPSGLYILQMRSGNFQATQKLSLVR